MILWYPYPGQMLRRLVQQGGKSDKAATEALLIGGEEHILGGQSAVQEVDCPPVRILLTLMRMSRGAL